MNELCMNIPTHMCHMAFVDDKRKIKELNGSDIDLFWVLVKLTSSRYYIKNKDKGDDEVKATGFNYKRKEIHSYLKTNSNLKDSFDMLNGLHIKTNLLNSYDDNKIKWYQPFEFGFTYDDYDKLQSIDVSVEEGFIKEFNNPKHPFTLSFEYLKSLIDPQAKLLYIILADRVSTSITENRNIDEDVFLKMINKKDKYSIKESEVKIRDLNKAIAKKTNIKFTVKYDTDRQKIGNDWLSFPKYRFEIIRHKPKVKCKKIKYNNEKRINEDCDKSDMNMNNDKSTSDCHNNVNKSKLQFDEATIEEANKRMENAEAKGRPINNKKVYRRTTCENIVKENKEIEEKKKQDEEQKEYKEILGNIDIKDFIDILEKKYSDYVSMKDYKLYYLFDEEKPFITNNAIETYEVLVECKKLFTQQ
ncbi:MAG: hypothetical protein U9N59_10740 [Campylobacterota bacterium]|nr:hypothetical protein [Campylobacterota bacterium]